jgi:hypothetical protein
LSTQALAPVEKALARESSVDDVLDVVDDAIEEAKRRDDPETLTALADLLDATASVRGGDWSRLAIAAMRARATAGAPAAEAPPAPVLPAPTVEPQAQARFALIRTAAFLDWLLVDRVHRHGAALPGSTAPSGSSSPALLSSPACGGTMVDRPGGVGLPCGPGRPVGFGRLAAARDGRALDPVH